MEVDIAITTFKNNDKFQERWINHDLLYYKSSILNKLDSIPFELKNSVSLILKANKKFQLKISFSKMKKNKETDLIKSYLTGDESEFWEKLIG